MSIRGGRKKEDETRIGATVLHRATISACARARAALKRHAAPTAYGNHAPSSWRVRRTQLLLTTRTFHRNRLLVVVRDETEHLSTERPDQYAIQRGKPADSVDNGPSSPLDDQLYALVKKALELPVWRGAQAQLHISLPVCHVVEQGRQCLQAL